jgi:LacI family transcriptional regulator
MKELRRNGEPIGRRATLKDVAELSGVSAMTVSNVVNATQKGYNAETRDRVLQAIRTTNYRPDAAARSLRTDRRMSIGMLVVQEARQFLADPYITNLLDGLCAGLNQHGYSLVLQSLSARETIVGPLVRQLQTDGLCLLMAAPFKSKSALAEAVLSLGQPVILFQQSPTEFKGDVCILRQDDFEGGRMLCSHLVERNCRDLVMIVPEAEWPAMQARLAGVRHQLHQVRSVARLTVLSATDESPAATEGALAGHLATGAKVDAVIAGNDQMAVVVHRMLIRRGVAIPDRVRLTGFNAFPCHDCFTPRLTSVRSPAFQIGMLGASHMIRRLENGHFETRTMSLPVELVLGETT